MSNAQTQTIRVGDIRRGDRFPRGDDVITVRHRKRHVRRDRPVRSAGAGIRPATTTITVRTADGRKDRWTRGSDEVTIIIARGT